MTADERIEKLLNRFGQTISDLPKPTNSSYAYGRAHRKKANYTAKIWDEELGFENNEDYICHLADIIDRLEIALETAVRCTDCGTCEFERTGECSGIIECNYRICDERLMDSDGMEGC